MLNWTPLLDDPKFWISFEVGKLDWIAAEIDWGLEGDGFFEVATVIR